MKRIGYGALVLGLATMLAGCKSDAYMKNAIYARAKTLQTSPEYRIGEGDGITVRLLGAGEGDDDSSIREVVRPDGKVSFPGHGDITVSGKTVEEIRAELQEGFKESLGLRNPRVYVAANAFASKNVTVLGEVNRPGRYRYTGQMRIADLLGLAVGTKETAEPNWALLFREIDGATKVYHVHLEDFFEKADFSTNFYIRPGDTLWVPMHGFAQVAAGIRKFLLPLNAIAESVGLGTRAVSFFVPAPAEDGGF
ncbi:MAG: polysaccharide export protein [Planctomycetota bacterium]|nr:polysaccharide export protein [Planctomycetota bacterium]